MSRIIATMNGFWFDAEKSQLVGHAFSGDSTEDLYQVSGGPWVLHVNQFCASVRNADGEPAPAESWQSLSEDEAFAWLARWRPAKLAEFGERSLVQNQAAMTRGEGALTIGTVAPPEQVDPVVRAIALMQQCEREGRSYKVKDLAFAVGVSRSTLYRDRHFRNVIKATRTGNKPKRGHKDAKGNLDAEDS